MINVKNVGHVVLKVRDLERSVRFYRDVLGLKDVARGTFGRPMVFFSATRENHHDLALFEVGPDAAPSEKNQVGLYHVALRIGHSLEELRAAKAHLEAHGVEELRLRDHTVSQWFENYFGIGASTLGPLTFPGSPKRYDDWDEYEDALNQNVGGQT